MRSFKQFLLEFEYGKYRVLETDAKLLYMGMKAYFRDYDNFKKVMATRHDPVNYEGFGALVGLFRMPNKVHVVDIQDLPINDDLKDKYKALSMTIGYPDQSPFHKLGGQIERLGKIAKGEKLAPLEKDEPIGLAAYGSINPNGKMKKVGWRIIKDIPFDIKCFLSLKDDPPKDEAGFRQYYNRFMHELSTRGHGIVTTTVHELQHVKQISRGDNLKAEQDHQKYLNSAHEVEARETQLRYELDRALLHHPGAFWHDWDKHQFTAELVMNNLMDVYRYTGVKKAQNWPETQKLLSPENQAKFVAIVKEFEPQIKKVSLQQGARWFDVIRSRSSPVAAPVVTPSVHKPVFVAPTINVARLRRKQYLNYDRLRKLVEADARTNKRPIDIWQRYEHKTYVSKSTVYKWIRDVRHPKVKNVRARKKA